MFLSGEERATSITWYYVDIVYVAVIILEAEGYLRSASLQETDID